VNQPSIRSACIRSQLLSYIRYLCTRIRTHYRRCDPSNDHVKSVDVEEFKIQCVQHFWYMWPRVV